MPSSFDTLFADKALPVLADKMGEDGVVYMPSGGDVNRDGIPLTHAMVGKETEEEYEADDGIRTRKVRMMTLITDRNHQNYCGMLDPLIAATVIYNGNTYSVLDVSRDASTAQLKLRNTMQIERTRQGFRRSTR